MFRAMVQNVIDGPGQDELVSTVRLIFRGKDLGRVPIANGGSFARSKDVAELAGWKLARFDEDDADFVIAGRSVSFPAVVVEGDSFVDCDAIVGQLKLTMRWDEANDTVVVE